MNKCLKTSRAQVDSFCFKEAYSYSPWNTSFNGFKTLASRLKTIFKFYIQDDFLHLLMPMSFFIGLQNGFMAKHFINVSILGVPSMKFSHSRQYHTSYDDTDREDSTTNKFIRGNLVMAGDHKFIYVFCLYEISKHRKFSINATQPFQTPILINSIETFHILR